MKEVPKEYRNIDTESRSYGLNTNINDDRRLEPEQVHGLLVRDLNEDGVSFSPKLCFSLNIAEVTLTKFINLLLKVKVSNSSLETLNGFAKETKEDLDKILKDSTGPSYLREVHPSLSEEVDAAFSNIYHLWNEIVKFYLIYDRNCPFKTYDKIHELLSSENEVLSIAILDSHSAWHWVGLSIYKNNIYFSDSFNQRLFYYNGLSYTSFQETIENSSSIFSTKFNELIHFIRSTSGKNSTKEYFNLLVRLRKSLVKIVDSSEDDNSDINTKITLIKNFVDTFISGLDSDSIDKNNPYITLEQELYGANDFDKHKEFFTKLTDLSQTINNILNQPCGENGKKLVDHINFILAVKEISPEDKLGLSFDSENVSLSCTDFYKSQQNNFIEALGKYFGNSNPVNVIDSHFSQQSGGYQCGYHTVANIRLQRQFCAANNTYFDKYPRYYSRKHEQFIVDSLKDEIETPFENNFLSAENISEKIDKSIQQPNTPWWPQNLGALSISLSILAGITFGIVSAVVSLKVFLIISAVAITSYFLALGIEDSPAIVYKNDSFKSGEFGFIETKLVKDKPKEQNLLDNIVAFSPFKK